MFVHPSIHLIDSSETCGNFITLKFHTCPFQGDDQELPSWLLIGAEVDVLGQHDGVWYNGCICKLDDDGIHIKFAGYETEVYRYFDSK